MRRRACPQPGDGSFQRGETMRWKAVCIGLAAALLATAGCKQQCFLSMEDLNRVQTISMPVNLARDPSVGCNPIIEHVPTPADINNPERQIRYMSLAEAISIALEQGSIGTPSNTTNGASLPFQDTDLIFSGRTVTAPETVRVLALDPAVVGSNIELALSKFDAMWSTSLTWNTTDRPVATATDVFSAGGVNSINTEAADWRTAIFKPLPTGGVTGITFDVPYQLTNTPARVNPAYTPSLQFAFEQPLLQGFGVEINQLRQSSPTSELLANASILSGLPQPGVEGILVTRIRFDQQRTEFQRNVNAMLANVEWAYWNLYYSYWNLYANEAALRQAYEAWKIAEVKLQAGKIAIADVAQARGQYELFRAQRLASLAGGTGQVAGVQDNVLERERELRGLLGLPAEDGTRLVPSDAPTLAAYHPDWDTALDDALNNAPSLLLLREQVKVDQLNIRLAENALLPDLRFGATYDINSIGSRLDGPDINNAFRNLASNHFHDWSLALRLNVPLGYRNAYANLRIAKLTLARDYESLREQERRVSFALTNAYRLIGSNYAEIEALRAQREAFGDQVKARFQEFQAGKITPDLLLEAQRFWAAALQQEYGAIRDYNNALTFFELVKGTIPQHDNVIIAEGPLPHCAAERAVEHQRQRSAALELRERAVPVPLAEVHADHSVADVPQGPDSHAAPLPELWQATPPLKDSPQLPPVPGAPAAKVDLMTPPGPMPPLGAKKPSDFGAVRPGAAVPAAPKPPDAPAAALPANLPPSP